METRDACVSSLKPSTLAGMTRKQPRVRVSTVGHGMR